MRDPDLLGKPNYTVHSNKKYKEEKTTFAIGKSVITLVLSLAALILVANMVANIGIIICFITPFGVCGGVLNFINYIGERRNLRYIEKTIPVELRLYDDCAIKYISEDGHEVYIQMPYENIRQCKYFSDADILCFTGNFRCVSFFSEDKQHSKPNYKEITTVNFPIDPSKLSEITSHSPIKVYKEETEGTISEKN